MRIVYELNRDTGDYYTPFERVGVFSSLEKINALLNPFYENYKSKRGKRRVQSRENWQRDRFQVDEIQIDPDEIEILSNSVMGY